MTAAEAPREVRTQDALLEALATVDAAELVAVDTEFMRVDTYYPKFCLLQVATPTAVFCIDPLADLDLALLGARLAATRQPKLMHAARQDLEVLAPIGAGSPQPLIDTQLAAALLGLSDQISYAAVVEQYCGIVIDKSQTRTDWSQRPLTAEQLIYAALDVTYLPPVWAAMERALGDQGKLEWLREECERLLAIRDDAAPAWQRVKGLAALEGRALAVACALAEWRESIARGADRPRNWILKDEFLLALARRLPRTLAALAEVQGMPASTVRRHGEALLALINEPDLAPPAALPGRSPRLTPAGTRLLGEFQQYVRERATVASVAPTLIAARRDLEQLIHGDGAPRLAHGWRAELVGAELVARRAQYLTEDLCLPV
jgi:ribonuclease D